MVVLLFVVWVGGPAGVKWGIIVMVFSAILYSSARTQPGLGYGAVMIAGAARKLSNTGGVCRTARVIARPGLA